MIVGGQSVRRFAADFVVSGFFCQKKRPPGGRRGKVQPSPAAFPGVFLFCGYDFIFSFFLFSFLLSSSLRLLYSSLYLLYSSLLSVTMCAGSVTMLRFVTRRITPSNGSGKENGSASIRITLRAVRVSGGALCRRQKHQSSRPARPQWAGCDSCLRGERH